MADFTRLWFTLGLSAFLSLGGVLAGCSGASGDDDATAGDDDSSLNGDDDVAGDDDASGDDDVTGGDDDSSGDDDVTSGDDDSGGDDDVTSGDDDSGGDDDVTSGDDDSGGDDDSTSSGPSLTSIYSLNQSPPANQALVVTRGVVTAISVKNDFWIEDANAGKFSGIYVFAEKIYPTGTVLPFKVGDEVEVKGLFQVYYDLREIAVYSDSGSVTVEKANAGVPPAQSVGLADLVQNACATGVNPILNGYVGVLLSLPKTTVVAASGACASSPSYGYWEIQDDKNFTLMMDDDVSKSYTPKVGDVVQASGVLFYSFSQYKLETTAVSTNVPNPTSQSIYELNQTPPVDGTPVDVTAVVTGLTVKGDFWVEDSKGGLYSGLFVLDQNHFSSALGIQSGDLVRLKGSFKTYYGLREIVLGTTSTLELVTPSAGLPPAVTVSTLSTVDVGGASVCATLQTSAEAYVGVLLKLPQAVVTSVEGACSTDPTYGVWQIKDSSGPMLVDDDIYYAYAPSLGQKLVLTGILKYVGIDTQYRIVPLGDAGIELK